jgi:hypothetical protein
MSSEVSGRGPEAAPEASQRSSAVTVGSTGGTRDAGFVADTPSPSVLETRRRGLGGGSRERGDAEAGTGVRRADCWSARGAR